MFEISFQAINSISKIQLVSDFSSKNTEILERNTLANIKISLMNTSDLMSSSCDYLKFILKRKIHKGIRLMQI